MAIRIDELNPTALPSRLHEVVAMLDGITVKLSLAQILDLFVEGAPEDLDTWLDIVTKLQQHDTHLGGLDDVASGLETNKQPKDAMLTALAALTSANGKFLAFSGADAPVMRDIVGTVSQSSGIPTGAIVERGSNANGSYVRLADGTQICSVVRSLNIGNISAAGNIYRDILAWGGGWTFPAAFASVPSVSFSLESSVFWLSGGATTTTGTGLITVLGYANFINTTNAHGIAIGRWF